MEFFTARLGQMAVPGPEPFYHLQSGIDAAMRIVEIRECAIPLKSSLRNSSFDFSEMTTVVAVVTDVLRRGQTGHARDVSRGRQNGETEALRIRSSGQHLARDL